MRRPRALRSRTRSGFTLIEASVAMSLLGALGYSIALAVDSSQRSQRVIAELTAGHRALRSTNSTLIDELSSSSPARITVTTLADGNHQLVFQMPIEVGGAADWGVHDRTLGADAASQNRSGWSIRYTVRNAVLDGGATKQLLRELLDEGGVKQRELVLLEGLCSGTEDPPGFRVVATGDVWEITLSTEPTAQGNSGTRQVFHVYARN